MNALSKLQQLVFGEAAALAAPPAVVEAVGVVTAPDDAEQAALDAVARVKATADDLSTRRDVTAAAIADLTERRSAAGRGLVSGETSDAFFAQVTSELDTARARLDALDALIVETQTAHVEAHAKLVEVQAPRLAAERHARIEELRLAAEAEVERLYASYRECCEATAAVADRLEALAGLDQNAADNIHRRTINYSTDPMLVLTTNGWKLRAPGLYTVAERRIVPLTPPTGGKG